MDEIINEFEENSLISTDVICCKCGYKFQPDFSYCPMCGKKAEKIQNSNKRNIVVIVLLSFIVVIGLFVIIFGFTKEENKSSTLKEQFADYSSECWCEIGTDDSYIMIDTNCFDIEKYSDDDALNAIENINAKLGFPKSVFKKMKSTSALDGRQQEENENFIVSWTYHPDNGIEVMYEKK